MNNNDTIFDRAFKEALKEVFNTQRQIDILPNEEKCGIEKDLDFWASMMGKNYNDDGFLENTYSSSNLIGLSFSENFADNIHLFFNYNEDKASKFQIAEGYSMADLYNDIRFDVFTWVASELLFKTPDKYDRETVSRYFSIGNASQKLEGKEYYNYKPDCAEKKWKQFKTNLSELTDRIKSFPMPPHFLMIYSDAKIEKKERAYRMNPAYDFFSQTKCYRSNNTTWENYIDFYKIIKKGLYSPMEEIYEQHQKLLSALVIAYNERVFGFGLVNYAVQEMNRYNRTNNLFNKQTEYFLFKLVKSNEMFISKFSFLSLFLSFHSEAYEYFRFVKAAFKSIAQKTFEKYIKLYKEQFPKSDPQNALKVNNGFDGLITDLSSSYETIFSDFFINKLNLKEPCASCEMFKKIPNSIDLKDFYLLEEMERVNDKAVESKTTLEKYSEEIKISECCASEQTLKSECDILQQISNILNFKAPNLDGLEQKDQNYILTQVADPYNILLCY